MENLITITANHFGAICDLRDAKPEIKKEGKFQAIYHRAKFPQRRNKLSNSDVSYLESKGIDFTNTKLPVYNA